MKIRVVRVSLEALVRMRAKGFDHEGCRHRDVVQIAVESLFLTHIYISHGIYNLSDGHDAKGDDGQSKSKGRCGEGVSDVAMAILTNMGFGDAAVD